VREAVALTLPDDDALRRGGAIEIEERVVTGPEGAPEVALLICRPGALVRPAPAIYFIHGGGMVLAGNRMGIELMLDWAVEFGTAVISVEYRVAPEHPDPAPIEDCYAGLVWTSEHACELGLDPLRLVLAGSSAGGGLAAGVSFLARDNAGPPLLGQLLMCPMLDDRNLTPSSTMLDGEGTWDRTSNDTSWEGLLGDRRGGPDVSIYAAPSRATDLSGLPPTFIDVGTVEIFRDEDVDFARAIWLAGGSAELHVWPGGFHGFEEFAPQATLSQACITARAAWLRRLLAP
jgi:acetyl esterase/lipase